MELERPLVEDVRHILNPPADPPILSHQWLILFVEITPKASVNAEENTDSNPVWRRRRNAVTLLLPQTAFAACCERDRTPFGAACSDLKVQGIAPLLGKVPTLALARCTGAEDQLWSWELEALQCGRTWRSMGWSRVRSSARGYGYCWRRIVLRWQYSSILSN